MASTIQERMQYLCDLMGLSPEKLSTRAGLSRAFVRRVIWDTKRRNISAEAAEKLSLATQVSRSWIVSGVGTPEANDVPTEWPLSEKRVAVEQTRSWPTIAKRAIDLDPKLDWAVMGVGEKPLPTEELTAYALLAEAERFKNKCDNAERRRLDRKARRFRKQYAPSPLHTTQTQQRQSVPPKG